MFDKYLKSHYKELEDLKLIPFFWGWKRKPIQEDINISKRYLKIIEKVSKKVKSKNISEKYIHSLENLIKNLKSLNITTTPNDITQKEYANRINIIITKAKNQIVEFHVVIALEYYFEKLQKNEFISKKKTFDIVYSSNNSPLLSFFNIIELAKKNVSINNAVKYIKILEHLRNYLDKNIYNDFMKHYDKNNLNKLMKKIDFEILSMKNLKSRRKFIKNGVIAGIGVTTGVATLSTIITSDKLEQKGSVKKYWKNWFGVKDKKWVNPLKDILLSEIKNEIEVSEHVDKWKLNLIRIGLAELTQYLEVYKTNKNEFYIIINLNTPTSPNKETSSIFEVQQILAKCGLQEGKVKNNKINKDKPEQNILRYYEVIPSLKFFDKNRNHTLNERIVLPIYEAGILQALKKYMSAYDDASEKKYKDQIDYSKRSLFIDVPIWFIKPFYLRGPQNYYTIVFGENENNNLSDIAEKLNFIDDYEDRFDHLTDINGIDHKEFDAIKEGSIIGIPYVWLKWTEYEMELAKKASNTKILDEDKSFTPSYDKKLEKYVVQRNWGVMGCHHPAIYLEMGFLNNSEDRTRLADPKKRAILCSTISNGLITYCKKYGFKKIILSRGHGDLDPGASYPAHTKDTPHKENIYTKLICEDIAQQLATMRIQSQILSYPYQPKKTRRASINARVSWTKKESNKTPKGEGLFVAIHCNATDAPALQTGGYMIYTMRGYQPKSTAMATEIVSEWKKTGYNIRLH